MFSFFLNFPTTIAATSWIFWGTSTPTGRDKHGRHGEANTVYACKLYAGNESDRLLPAGAWLFGRCHDESGGNSV